MDEYNRESLYQAMYASEDTRDPEPDLEGVAQASGGTIPALSQVTIPIGLRMHRIVTEEGSFTVPTMAYVGALERLLAEQARVITELRSPSLGGSKMDRTVADQGRSIRRLEHSISVLRNFIRRQTGRMGDMQNDLDSKIDRRD